MSLRRYLTYGGIAAASLALGAIEGAYNTPCIFKPALVAVPLASASIGAYIEHREAYGSDLGVFYGMEEGIDHVFTVAAGTGTGVVLSAACEAAGFGLVKLLS